MSAVQAAELIGISRAAVHKAVHAGKIQALRIGNVTVINRKSAVEYLRNRESVMRARASRGKARKALG
ncbi:MAG: helix-turn-helix domain-containing protein [Planctomycetota bacterium]